MGSYEGLKARLVWDGGNSVSIPEEMGKPRDDQMQGTVAEQLTELCGRVCYDSLGKGRPSDDFFDHILGVGHLSIAEHFNASLELVGDVRPDVLISLLNRPWVWVSFPDRSKIRITTNLRAVREWDKWSKVLAGQAGNGQYPILTATKLGYVLKDRFKPLAPRIVPKIDEDLVYPMLREIGFTSAYLTEPENNGERWITIYMVGSRGFSHEQVRHGDFTAISQRSTRYCEESESPWIIHPLMQEYMRDEGVSETDRAMAKELTEGVVARAQHGYRWWVDKLVEYIKPRVSGPYAKTTARKQARGAARGLLGNALETEVIFSASVLEWHHMINMRCAGAADAEIRNEYVELLPLLKNSRYGREFEGFDLAPAADGIGMELADGGHK